MKKTMLAVVLGSMIGVSSASEDERYVGLNITVPFSLDAIGAQVVGRYDNVEARAGLDTRGVFQLGAGATDDLKGHTGEVKGSLGLAYSSYHNRVVPYAAVTDGNEWFDESFEYGVVSYIGGLNADTLNTTYVFAGVKEGWDNDDGRSVSIPATEDEGEQDPEPPVEEVSRSGLGDNTNPGNSEQDSNGQNNPNNS